MRFLWPVSRDYQVSVCEREKMTDVPFILRGKFNLLGIRLTGQSLNTLRMVTENSLPGFVVKLGENDYSLQKSCIAEPIHSL